RDAITFRGDGAERHVDATHENARRRHIGADRRLALVAGMLEQMRLAAGPVGCIVGHQFGKALRIMHGRSTQEVHGDLLVMFRIHESLSDRSCFGVRPIDEYRIDECGRIAEWKLWMRSCISAGTASSRR